MKNKSIIGLLALLEDVVCDKSSDLIDPENKEKLYVLIFSIQQGLKPDMASVNTLKQFKERIEQIEIILKYMNLLVRRQATRANIDFDTLTINKKS